MNTLFISQNAVNKKVVTSELHYYGPYINYGNNYAFNQVLLGIQFSEPLLIDDQERYAHLSFDIVYNTAMSTAFTSTVDLDLDVGVLEDPPQLPPEVLGMPDRFVFPVTIQRSFTAADPIWYISAINNIQLNIYNPEKDKIYKAPTQFTRDEDVIGVIIDGSLDPKSDWKGQYRTSLINSSRDEDILTVSTSFTDSPVVFRASALCYRPNFLSSLIRPSVDTYYTSKTTGTWGSDHSVCTNYKCLSRTDYSRDILFEDDFRRPLPVNANTWGYDVGNSTTAGSVTTDDWGDYVVYKTEVTALVGQNRYQCNFCGYIEEAYRTPTTACPQCSHTDWSKI